MPPAINIAADTPRAIASLRIAALAASSARVYTVAFDDLRGARLKHLLPSPPSSWNRRTFSWRDRDAARSVGTGRHPKPANRQETRRPSRPHPHQSLLRGLDQDPKLVPSR